MNEEIRVGGSGHRFEDGAPRKRGNKMLWVILGLVVVLLVVAGLLFKNKLFSGMKDTPAGGSGFQAIFLTNGQVYFGKLSKAKKEFVLQDVYYLQVTQAVQGPRDQGQQGQPQQQLQLVKLGNELHGPVDAMHINPEHMLFYEDIKEDGKVYQAIKDHKSKPAQ